MPLPAALLARLQKRGIVKDGDPVLEIEEEVIAEDYDDNEKQEERSNTKLLNETDPLRESWFGCPNKWNIYHECTGFCKKTFGAGKENASPKTDRKRLAMLRKYPVPAGWEEVYDPGSGRHYYWNTKSEEVAWLPPTHPRCKIGPPAEKLRALVRENFLEPMDEGEDLSESDGGSGDEEMEEDREEKRRQEKLQRREKQLAIRSKGRPKVRENDLDPMDPAAYSEAPRGGWSTGLERKGEAKTGADTTAAGPLFQMRPYPSPGAVLRMNAEIRKVDSDEEED